MVKLARVLLVLISATTLVPHGDGVLTEYLSSISAGSRSSTSSWSRLLAEAALQSPTLAFAAHAEGEAVRVGERRTLHVGGEERPYLLFTPLEPVGEPVPLLIALHGRGGTAEGFADSTQLHHTAGAAQAIVAYPEGVDREWNYLTGLGGNQGPDDVRFLSAVIEDIGGHHPIDPHRVFVAGYSNGGFMAQRLACEPGSRLAAIALVATAGFPGMPTLCTDTISMSVLHVHGTADGVVPWGGQTALLGGRELVLSASVPQTFAFWSGVVGCEPSIDRRVAKAADGVAIVGVEVLASTDCQGGHRVLLYAILGADHDWPGAYVAAASDTRHAGFDISSVIWDYFLATPEPVEDPTE